MSDLRSVSRSRPQKGLTLFPLIMSIFFVVSGGPYAMEKLVSSSGAGVALILILVTPLVWSLPTALMTAELTSAMPREGGYYVWVKEGLGPFAGFLCGWWSWVYSWVDMSLYPALFVTYLFALLKLVPAFSGLSDLPHQTQWLLGVATMVPLVWLNIRGIRIAGETNLYFGLILLAPFVVMVLIASFRFADHPRNVFAPLTPNGTGLGPSAGTGLFLIMWNYLAWDSLSTVAGEADKPAVNFPRALFWSLPLILGAYILTFSAGLVVVPDISKWIDGAWPAIAAAAGGRWLGIAIACGAVLSVLGMYNATLLSASRVPYVLAEDGYLPKAVAKMHPRYKTPWMGIVISAAVSTVLAIRSFDTLIAVDILVYSSGLILEFVALLVLRYKRPEMARPYRIPGGFPVIWILVLLPTILVCGAFWVTLKDQIATMITLASLASGPILYALVQLSKLSLGRRKA